MRDKVIEKKSESLIPAELQMMNQPSDPRLPKQYDLSQDDASERILILGKESDIQTLGPDSKDGNTRKCMGIRL